MISRDELARKQPATLVSVPAGELLALLDALDTASRPPASTQPDVPTTSRDVGGLGTLLTSKRPLSDSATDPPDRPEPWAGSARWPRPFLYADLDDIESKR